MAEFNIWREPETNNLCFSGAISQNDLASLRLDRIERLIISSEATSAADHLQSLEIIFRCLHKQLEKQHAAKS